MKTLYTLIFLIFFGSNVFSQSYDFSYTTGNYANLEGATDLTNGNAWTSLDFVIPIGFDFEFYGESFNTMHIRSYIHFDDGDMYFINQFYSGSFVDRGDSPVSYLLEGSAGNRILKIEWQNMGFSGELNSLGTTDDFINSQLWLYETTNNIELRIGPSSIIHPDESYIGWGGPWIGICHAFSFNPADVESISLEGDPANPDIIYNDNNFSTFLTGTPADGIIYKFCYNANAVNQTFLDTGVDIFPNPSSGIVNIKTRNRNTAIDQIKIFDSKGLLLEIIPILKQSIDKVTEVNLSGFPAGIYFFQIINQKRVEYKKLILK
ncbi:MAG: T9SS type A sorting domain-containing protein [Bacteroidales bacterium]|nr:T9SS type A sorting domain-containing protein [Bacteroidales bacterium]